MPLTPDRRPYRRPLAALLLFALLALLLSSCQKRSHGPELALLRSDFVYGVLALSPVLATSSGYHEHLGTKLDEQLDDFSSNGIQYARKFYLGMRARLGSIDQSSLTPDELADYNIISDQIALGLLEFDDIQAYRHNPTIYVELIGSALFTPLILEYAPLPRRIEHIIARLEKIPALVDSAKRNLIDSPEIWRTVAIEENRGNIALIDKTIREKVPENLAGRYSDASARASVALEQFTTWMESDLARRTSDWRLGSLLYARKLRAALGTSMSPADILRDAETMLEDVRNQMLVLSKPMVGDQSGSLNQVVAEALRKVASKHATPDSYFEDARRDLQEARQFVREKNLLALPPRDNLTVIPTPEFMRGIYAVGGFSSAPPLQPELGAFYWLTPIPADWPKERIESKLREYNFYGLKLLTIHEAMPGHYVQLEYANEVTPADRRVLRSVFGSGPYVEGWAVYATEMMLDAGYLNNSPELRLTFLKQQLRMIANAILDVRMQTQNMSDADAMSLMLDQTFQEKEEATAKLQRAKLSSTQLPTYFTGYREWVKLRAEKKNLPLNQFHEKALRPGAVPMRALSKIVQ